MKIITTRRLVIRKRGGGFKTIDAGKPGSATHGKDAVRAGGVLLSDDREKQTFEQALRETIEQNRAALIKLAKH